MKKIVFLLAFIITSVSLPAQLTSSKWKGTFQGDNPQEVIFDFRKDTAVVYTTGDSSHIETMTYTVKDKVLTLVKIHGISDCDSAPGKYTITLEKDSMIMKRLDDNCDDRVQAIDTIKWTRFKSSAGEK